MKKLLTLSICALLGLSAMAQQLPNAGFEEWKSKCGSSEAFGTGGISGTSPVTGEFRERPGKEPQGWNGSSVNQKVGITAKKELLAEESYVGKALKLFNKKLGLGNMSAVAPGFVTLGTPWVYAIANVKVCDGGTYGGVDFSYRPDELQLDIKRTDSNNEISSVIAYFWNGEFKSKVGEAGKPTQVRSDVDRAVMGRVTPDEAGSLLASVDEKIATTNNEWVNKRYAINWANDEKPTKMNVIICSGNYWDRQSMMDETTIIVDNVKFVYYSRLKSLIVGEQEVVLEDGRYEYSFDFVMPENEAFVYEVLGKDATATVVRDEVKHTATIKVANADADTDGEKEHNYVLSFAAPEKPIEGDEYKGTLTIEMFSSEITGGGTAANVIITSVDANTCIFTLPNFTLDLGDGPQLLGDIVVENVTISEKDGLKYYEGTKNGLELAGVDIIADVTLAGTIDAEGNADMLIDVMWGEIPIYVDFFTKEREPETFGGFIGHKASADGAITNEYDGTMSLTCVSRNIYKFEMTGVDLDALSRATGNIVVENVLVTKDNKGNRTFAGESDNAKVEGTIDAAKKATVKVEYKESADAEPKYIEFNTNKVQTGVDEIEAAGNGEVEYYNLQGIRVANPESGIYIRRQGSKVSKVYVK